jgi:hypothetical protein
VEAEAEPTETVLEETEAVEAEPMEAAADEVEEAVIEEAVVARAEPEEAVLEETTMETYDWLSSVDLDKVKKYPSLYCRQETKKSWPIQTTGRARKHRKKKFHSVILKKERRPKSVSIKWNQATSSRGQRQVKLHKLNDREREERREQLKMHASQLWQDSVFKPRPGRVGSRDDREKRFKELYNYMLAKLKVANTPPAIIARVLSTLVAKRFQTIRFLVPNFFPIGGVT